MRIMLTTILRYFHTIRFLKLSQILWRAINLFKVIDTNRLKDLEIRESPSSWYKFKLARVGLLADHSYSFLNQRHYFDSSIDWNSKSEETLWLFNLHYFDDLNTEYSYEKNVWLRDSIDQWISKNKPLNGVGWESYTLSLRIVNWVKYFLNGEQSRPLWLESLALQTHVLSQNIEYHLLGNHILANAKALIFSGLYFNGMKAEQWLDKGLDIYTTQLDEQILMDGGHFELSPMYHNIILHDLLDLINIAKAYNNKKIIKFTDRWTEVALRMLSWSKAMKHPDGEISFFNDSAFEIAPTYKTLVSYAKILQIEANNSDYQIQGLALRKLKDSGYIRVDQKNLVAILDCARIGPDYLPGHGHADCLSFEMSLFNQRVFVNSGTSCYGLSPQRIKERGTAAHNTVIVNNTNSSDIWSSFRVSKRAFPFDLNFLNNNDECIISCSHDGYRRLKNSITHKRSWKFLQDAVVITDNLDGKFASAEAIYHIHPDISSIKHSHNSFVLNLPGDYNININILSGEATLIDTYWHPEFGKSIPIKAISIKFTSSMVALSVNGYI